MLITSQLLQTSAMCRECAKQFSSHGEQASVMYQAIDEHLHMNPGHVVIGTEQHRAIFKKEESCIAH